MAAPKEPKIPTREEIQDVIHYERDSLDDVTVKLRDLITATVRAYLEKAEGEIGKLRVYESSHRFYADGANSAATMIQDRIREMREGLK